MPKFERKASRRSRKNSPVVYVHRFIHIPGDPPLLPEMLIPTLVTLDGTLPRHLSPFTYTVEKLN